MGEAAEVINTARKKIFKETSAIPSLRLKFKYIISYKKFSEKLLTKILVRYNFHDDLFRTNFIFIISVLI